MNITIYGWTTRRLGGSPVIYVNVMIPGRTFGAVATARRTGDAT
jgi:hypothetical protein